MKSNLCSAPYEKKYMIKQPTLRIDGQPMTKQQRAVAPFQYCVDTCAGRAASERCLVWNFTSVRFEGWAASTRGRTIRIMALVDGMEPQEFSTDLERPDVVGVLNQMGNKASLKCGFNIEVRLPHFHEDSVIVSLVFSDEEFLSEPNLYRIERFVSMQWEPNAADITKKARALYKDVWNEVSKDSDAAKMAVTGYTDEEEYKRVAHYTLNMLKETVGIRPEDVVLEIGAGVGRVGSVLAPICAKWIATDVSENMLKHAQERLRDYDNIEVVPTNGWDLAPIQSESVDKVYCTVVFMHLDEWDRFNYVCEAKRILKPKGRIYIDNYNLLSELGWDFFMKNMLDYHPVDRPSNISKSSTPQELLTYLERAGFIDVKVFEDEIWVYAWGIKP